MKLFLFLLAMFVASTAGAYDDVAGEKAFQVGYYQAVEVSQDGQSEKNAKAAAVILAKRKLLEFIKGARIFGETMVSGGRLMSDIVVSSTHGYVTDTTPCGIEFIQTSADGTGYAKACLRKNIRGRNSIYEDLGAMIAQKPKGLGFSADDSYARPAPWIETPKKLFDGLIVDTRGTGFKPGLSNRIVTQHSSIVFDSSLIEISYLIERGAGGYSVDERKAKVLLESWESDLPLLVKGVRAQDVTNIVISDEDAETILAHSKETLFLSKGQVVFILN